MEENKYEGKKKVRVEKKDVNNGPKKTCQGNENKKKKKKKKRHTEFHENRSSRFEGVW